MNINSLNSPLVFPGLSSQSGPANQSSGFASVLESAIGEVESSQRAAGAAASDFLTGGKGDVHNIALASQNAELSMELFQQVKNKFVQAYQEIMKTTI